MEKEIIKYYETHTIKETKNKFNISTHKLYKILNDNNVERHLSSFNHQKKKTIDEKVEEFLSKNDINEFIDFYTSNSTTETKKKYKTTSQIINIILKKFNIKSHTVHDGKRLSYINKYGTYEEGIKLEINKRINSIDYDDVTQKRFKTNLERYGSISPFGSKEVQNKTKKTNLERYGVENIFQSDKIKKKIKETSENKYGGIGFSSLELNEKYKSTMMNKYGVEYGCQLQQCINHSRGCNSKPNNHFENLLKIDCDYRGICGEDKEISLGSYRYDFKVNNTFIEINPTYTHNSTISYKTRPSLESDYHKNKSEYAKSLGYNCIHIWDWDDELKIIQLLDRKDKIYARKCVVKEVSKKESKEFINKYHLQNWVNSTINLGLYYNNELISIMTFGKPRYNKNYEYELLRYCSSKNIVGGAEKLFKHFIDDYNVKSIISYCDLSKFSGNVYIRLGFKSSQKKIVPSKHWYNIKTERHITDNLLRQQGFDRLFNTNYGKGTSNEDLMKENGFLEVYDCGQKTFTWKR